MQNFRDLRVWQEAHQLTLGVYQVTHAFPREELFGLSSQLRRAAVSIASNIAEGCGRSGSRDLRRFLDIAMGSACETEYQLLLSFDLNYLDQAGYQRLDSAVINVKRMLTGFIYKLRSQDSESDQHNSDNG